MPSLSNRNGLYLSHGAFRGLGTGIYLETAVRKRVRSWAGASSNFVCKRALTLNAISLFFLSLIAFRNNSELLFYGFDGRFEVSLIAQGSLFAPELVSYSGDFIHGLGNVWFTVKPSLLPEYFLSLSENGVFTNFPLAYAICATELFFLINLASRMAGCSRAVGLISAWLLPLLVFQYFGWNKVPSTFHAFPHYATVASIGVVMSTALLHLNQTRKALAFGIFLFEFCGVSYIIFVAPTLVILVAPVMIAFGVASCCSAATRQDFVFRAAIMAGVAGLCLLLGYVHFIVGLVTYTAANMFHGLSIRGGGIQEVSMLFWMPISRPFSLSQLLNIERTFVGLGLAGAAWAIARSTGILRTAAAAFLVLALIYLSVGIAHSYYAFWFGPALWYFEGFLFPLHAMFSVFLAIDLLILAWAAASFYAQTRLRFDAVSLKSRLRSVAATGVLAIAIVPWPYVFNGQAKTRPDLSAFSPYPQAATSITRVLKQEVAVRPGIRFSGRVATLNGRVFGSGTAVESGTLWSGLLSLRGTGNDHSGPGLWQDSIPTLTEYNQLMTPPYFVFIRSFFTEPIDRQTRNIVLMRHINPRLLAAAGVRFVITDYPFQGLRLDQVLDVPVSPAFLRHTGIQGYQDFTLHLYELDDVNLGQYSPIEVRPLASANEMIETLGDAAFDLKKSVITIEPLPGSLQPGILQEFSIGRGEYTIRASSPGRSILILPLEFSRCLHLRTKDEAKIFRADFLFTGILFERKIDATLRYQTGPIFGSRCRLDDAQDMSAIDVKNAFKGRPQFEPSYRKN